MSDKRTFYSLSSTAKNGAGSASKGKAAGVDSSTESALNPAAPGNKAPKAHAGKNQNLTDADNDGKEAIELDGSKSNDKDGEIISYSWSIEGTDIILATGANPTVELPVGTTTILLTVTDNEEATGTAKVKINIREGDEEEEPANSAPVANAGGDQELSDTDRNGVEAVEFDGSASTDAEGEIGSYSWSLNNEEIATGVSPTVNLGVGSHTVVLTVTDAGDLTATDEVVITINAPANTAPVADAGKDQELTDTDRNGEEEVTLDGSASTDAEGEISSYVWSIAGNEIATEANPTVDLSVGTHTIQLTVTDANEASATDEVVVTINAPENTAPTADAGEAQILIDTDRNGVEAVELDGSASTDAEGEINSYSWTLKDIEIATEVNPMVELPVGTHTIKLTVTDEGELKATDEVQIIIKLPANTAPVADAGVDQAITDTDKNRVEEVVLDGTASTDAEGEIESYSWSLNNKEIATGINPTVELPVGTHTIELSVADAGGLTTIDEVVITINAPAIEPAILSVAVAKEASEASPSGRFVITSTEALQEDVAIRFQLAGTAVEGEDYVINKGTVEEDPDTESGKSMILKAGQTSLSIPINVEKDDEEEGDETIILSLSEPDREDLVLSETASTATMAITDNAPANTAPIADAGEAQTLTDTEGDGVEEVSLDGSGSTDAEGEIESYSWSIAGDEIATGVNPTVELPVGATTIKLTVTDAGGLTAIDEVVVTINEPANTAPIADAGEPQTLTDEDGDGVEEVSLDGSASTDTEGEITYSWSLNNEEIASEANPTVALPVGTHTIQLTVTDEEGLTATGEVVITINAPAVLSVVVDGNGTEDGAIGYFLVSTTIPLDRPLTINYSLRGTAVEGKDYALPTGAVVLNAGENIVRIPVSVVDDEEVEGDETVVLQLNSVEMAGVILDPASSSAEMIIRDNEGCFTISEKLSPASCSGTTDGAIDITVKGSSAKVSYSWSNGFKGEDLQNVAAGTYELEVVDQVSGCSLTREFVIQVNDQTPPVAKGKNLVVQLGTNGQASLTANALNDGSTDNCGISKMSVNKTTFSCTDIGEQRVMLTVEDVNGNTASTALSVLVEDNLAPVFAAAQAFSIPENVDINTVVGTVEANDNCQSLSWDIVEGNENSLFQIDQAGQIRTLGELDYERFTKHDLAVRITAGTQQRTEVVTVQIENLDEPGPDIGILLDDFQSVNEDELYSFRIPPEAFEAPEGEVLQYNLFGQPEWISFNSNTLQLQGTPGNEDVGIERITIRATDSQGRFAEQHFVLEVLNVNDAPHSLSLSRNLIQENQPEGTAVGHLSHEDVDEGDQGTYHFVSGEGDQHNSYFTLSNADLLSTRPIDYEVDSSLSIRLAVTDLAGATFEQVFTIKVGNEVDGSAFLPNLFSPNGDQMNDNFVLQSTHIEEVHWRIYNRQGRLIYETRDVVEATQIGWDGTAFGEDQPEGSYVWILEGIYNDGTPILINEKTKGSITLIR